MDEKMYLEKLTAAKEERIKLFEAGFIAASAGYYPLPEEEVRKRMQHAWKKFCGCNS